MKVRPKWADDVKLEDLQSETMKGLAETIGLEATMKLIRMYSGAVIYIPKADAVERVIRDRHIREEYDGLNTRKLALKYDVSESWVRRVANERQIFGQVDMFDVI